MPESPEQLSIATLASQVDEIGESVHWTHEIGNVLAELWTADGDMSPAQVALVEALRYEIVQTNEGWQPQAWISGAGGLEFIDAEGWSVVAEVAALLSEPTGRARLEELLWDQKVGDKPITHGLNALAACLEVCRDHERLIYERTRCARRAVDLTLSMSQPTEGCAIELERLAREIAANMQDRNDDSRLVEVVTAWAQLRVDSAAEPDLISLAEGSTNDPHLLVELAGLRAKLDPSGSPHHYGLAIQRFLDMAGSADAMYRYVFTEKALQLAQRVGHPRAASIRVDIQKLDAFSDTEPVRTTIPTSLGEIDRNAREVVAEDTFEQAIQRFVHQASGIAHGPVSGDDAEPTGFLDQIRGSTMGAHSSTVRRKEAGQSRDVASRDSAAFTVNSMLTPALTRIFDAYRPTMSDLTRWVEIHPLINEPISVVFGDGLLLFGERRFEASASTLLPRIEQLVRKAAVEQDIVVTKEPSGQKRGGVKGMDSILHSLSIADSTPLSADLAKRLSYFLTEDQLGFNLRNTTLHGLSERNVHAWEATLVILCLAELVETSQ